MLKRIPTKLSVEIYRTTKFRLAATSSLQDEITTILLPGFRCSVKDIFQLARHTSNLRSATGTQTMGIATPVGHREQESFSKHLAA